jgi:cytochrome c peroxidase
MLPIGLALLLVACGDEEFSESERRIFASLSLSALGTPASASNRFANDKTARELGEMLFHDPRLSSTGTFSCVSCHHAGRAFTDGQVTATAIGQTSRNTPTLSGAAWQTWFYWDGRRDSLWSQALGPIEAANEMGNDRVAVTRFILSDPRYGPLYREIFGSAQDYLLTAGLPDHASPFGNSEQRRNWHRLSPSVRDHVNRVFSNVGKAIGAFEHTLAPPRSRFDEFADKVASGASIGDRHALSRAEIKGARLFIDDARTQCLQCHNGPLFSNGDFHNTGTLTRNRDPKPGEVIDAGRSLGAQAAVLDEFNCVGRYSDAKPDQCTHLVYMNREQQLHQPGAFKTPTLRHVSVTAPYFHDGRHQSLAQVMEHYLNAPGTGVHEIRERPPLSEEDMANLIAFMRSLTPAADIASTE